jgi:hypothetical protein
MWQARRDLNPQHPDLESDALPLELLACMQFSRSLGHWLAKRLSLLFILSAYLVSLCGVCLRQNRQYLLNSSLSGVVLLFLVVL